MTRVALLGSGAMGSRIAHHLLNAQHEVIVYNRTSDNDNVKSLLAQGAVYATTPRDAAQQAEIVISMVTDDDASRSVWLDPDTGALLGLREGSITIESSTLTVAWTTTLAAEIESRGAAFLDAPVVGSRPQAEAGNLIYLVGGRAENLARVQDILRCASSAIHHIGAIGQGMAMKLAVNALFGIQVAALAEVLGMLTKAGVTSATAMACLGDLPVLSPAAKGAGNLMVANNHVPLFPINLVEKDFRYVLQTAQAVEAPTPVSAAIHAIYQDAIAYGYGNDNITKINAVFHR